MPKEQDLRMGEYNISVNRYRELKYFCRQYREKQRQLREMTEIGATSMREGGRGAKVADTTANTAMRRAELERGLEIIEQAAKEADAEIYSYIISNVADGIPYEYLGAPIGRRKFYEMRRKFFFILSGKKGN